MSSTPQFKLVDPPEAEFEAHCRSVIEGLAGDDNEARAGLLNEALRRGREFITSRNTGEA